MVPEVIRGVTKGWESPLWLWILGTEGAGELSVGLRNPSDGSSLLFQRGAAVEAKGILFSRDSETLELASLLWGQVTKYKSPGV